MPNRASFALHLGGERRTYDCPGRRRVHVSGPEAQGHARERATGRLFPAGDLLVPTRNGDGKPLGSVQNVNPRFKGFMNCQAWHERLVEKISGEFHVSYRQKMHIMRRYLWMVGGPRVLMLRIFDLANMSTEH